MSGGDWEVVGSKYKKDKQASKKMSKKEKQKFLENVPKLEDLLPASEAHAMYNAMNADASKKSKNNTIKKDEPKKQEKKVQKAQNGKKSVPRKPVTFTAALTSLGQSQNFEDLKFEIEVGDKRFSEIPLMRLSNLAAYLNHKLASEKYSLIHNFATLHMPLKQLSSNVHNSLKKVVASVGESSISEFFPICLTTAIEEHNKGLQINGYLLFLQILSESSSTCVSSNIAQIKSLLDANSKKPTCCSIILWACCLEALRSFFAGYKAFTAIMIQYLDDNVHSAEVFLFLQYLFSNSHHIRPVSPTMFSKFLHTFVHPPISRSKQNKSHFQDLLPLFIKSASNSISSDSLHEYFEVSFKYLSPSLSERLATELCKFSVKCLISNPKTASVWKSLFAKNLPQSAILLKYLYEKHHPLQSQIGNGNAVMRDVNGKGDSRNSQGRNNLDKKSPEIKGMGVDLSSMFSNFQKITEDLSRKKKSAEGLSECKKLLEQTLVKNSKMTVKPKHSTQQKSSFSWSVLLFIIIFAAGSLVAYDINKHGSFKASKTGVFLKESGTLKYVDQAFAKTKVYYDHAFKWTKKNVPIYYNSFVEFATPYAILARDTSIIAFNNTYKFVQTISAYVQQKWPLFIQWLDQYLPEGYTQIAQEFLANVFAKSKLYFWKFVELSVEYLKYFDEWFRKNLFTGNMSPEQMRKYASIALNSTQQYALETYSWLAQKVETTLFSTKIK